MQSLMKKPWPLDYPLPFNTGDWKEINIWDKDSLFIYTVKPVNNGHLKKE